MSIETFFNEHPADSDFAWRIAKREEFSPHFSRIQFLGNIFISEGASGLNQLSSKLSDENVQIRGFDPAPPSLSAENDRILGLNRAAVVFGISLEFLENTLMTGKFEEAGFRFVYKEALWESPWKPELPNDLNQTSAEIIPEDKLAKMRKEAQQDRTLTSFFENMSDLPKRLKFLIGASGSSQTIRSFILLEYKERARLLLKS